MNDDEPVREEQPPAERDELEDLDVEEQQAQDVHGGRKRGITGGSPPDPAA